jgi:hypothetical protein
VAQRTIAKTPDELVKRSKNRNPEHHTEHWRVLDRQPELEGQRLILIGRDSHETIKEKGYKIFTGLTIKVLRDPNAGWKQVEGAAVSLTSFRSVSTGEWIVISTPSGIKITEWRRATETWGKYLQLLNIPLSLCGEPELPRKEEGMETDLLHSETKEKVKGGGRS